MIFNLAIADVDQAVAEASVDAAGASVLAATSQGFLVEANAAASAEMVMCFRNFMIG